MRLPGVVPLQVAPGAAVTKVVLSGTRSVTTSPWAGPLAVASLVTTIV